MSWQTIEMPSDEFCDFCDQIRRSGRFPDDFKYEYQERVGSSGPIEQRVTVRTKFGEKTYQAGHGTAWLAEFDRDLIASYFN